MTNADQLRARGARLYNRIERYRVRMAADVEEGFTESAQMYSREIARLTDKLRKMEMEELALRE